MATRLRSTTWRNEFEIVRDAVLVEGLLADAATGDVHADVESAQRLDRRGDRLLGALEVGDVALEEDSRRSPPRPRHPRCPGRSRMATFAPAAATRSAVARAMPDAPPTTITRAPLISMRSSSAGRRCLRARFGRRPYCAARRSDKTGLRLRE